MTIAGHIAWHASAGFVWLVLENPAAIQKDMQIPGVVAQTCPSWDKWTAIPGDVTRKCCPPPVLNMQRH